MCQGNEEFLQALFSSQDHLTATGKNDGFQHSLVSSVHLFDGEIPASFWKSLWILLVPIIAYCPVHHCCHFLYFLCRAETEEHTTRLEAVAQEIERTGTYQLTKEELIFATKQAWRNAPRCIGRIQWSNLQVIRLLWLFQTYQILLKKPRVRLILFHSDISAKTIRRRMELWPSILGPPLPPCMRTTPPWPVLKPPKTKTKNGAWGRAPHTPCSLGMCMRPKDDGGSSLHRSCSYVIYKCPFCEVIISKTC